MGYITAPDLTSAAVESYVNNLTNLAGDPNATYDGTTLTIPTVSTSLIQAHADALAWNAVRVERTTLIRETDWTQMADVKLTAVQKANWRVYRQALRDITTQPDPANITWPTTPGGI